MILTNYAVYSVISIMKHNFPDYSNFPVQLQATFINKVLKPTHINPKFNFIIDVRCNLGKFGRNGKI